MNNQLRVTVVTRPRAAPLASAPSRRRPRSRARSPGARRAPAPSAPRTCREINGGDQGETSVGQRKGSRRPRETEQQVAMPGCVRRVSMGRTVAYFSMKCGWYARARRWCRSRIDGMRCPFHNKWRRVCHNRRRAGAGALLLPRRPHQRLSETSRSRRGSSRAITICCSFSTRTRYAVSSSVTYRRPRRGRQWWWGMDRSIDLSRASCRT